ncbi:MAG: hypothetical protein HY905_20205 [Deltaproteobacteria bacterium]|nr:hypothetical protein [Deltaproteobacteria bacterium]
MAASTKWAVVVCAAMAVGGACKKKTEEAPAPPAAATDAGAQTAGEAAAAATDAGAAGPATTTGGEAGAAPVKVGGGGSLLAGLFGGGRGRPGVAGAASSAAPPAPALEAVRDTGRALLATGSEPAFRRAVDAAELATELKAIGASAPAATAAARGPDAAAVPEGPSAPPPPDDPDPCATLIPAMMRCLSEEFGEALGAEEAIEALEECRKEFGDWPGEQQAALRSCNAVAECGAKMECIATMTTEGEDEDEGGEDEGDEEEPVAMPGDADLCTKMVIRSAQCVDVELPAEDLGPAVEECRRGLTELPPGAQEQMVACLERDCDQMWECMGEMDLAGGDDDQGSSDEGSGAGDLFGTPPDPARVAALPAETREMCAQLPAALDRCWDTLMAAAMGATADPAAADVMAGMKEQLLSGVSGMCLTAALDDPATFGEISAARHCLALPCDQMMTCLEQSTGM